MIRAVVIALGIAWPGLACTLDVQLDPDSPPVDAGPRSLDAADQVSRVDADVAADAGSSDAVDAGSSDAVDATQPLRDAGVPAAS